MSIKVLHVFDHSVPLQSGYSFRSLAILREHRRLGWETQHVTSPKHVLWSGSAAFVETVDGLSFSRAEPPAWPLRKIPVLNELAIVHGLSRFVERRISTWKPGIIHAHSPALNGAAALLAARRRNVPVVYEIRAFWEDAAVNLGNAREWGLRYRLTRRLETEVANRAAAVVCLCAGLRDDLVNRGVPEQKIFVASNGVELQRWEVTENRHEVRLKYGLESCEVLGFVGSFYDYEGIDLLLEAAAMLKKSRPKLRVLLVGGGPMESRIVAAIGRLGIGDIVTMTGRISNSLVSSVYDAIDLCVFPRKAMRLTELVTPLKPLEAMAKGKPVVASNVGGHRELIRADETGVLVKPDDADALAAGIARVLESSELRSALAHKGRAYVEKNHAWRVIAGVYREAFEYAGVSG